MFLFIDSCNFNDYPIGGQLSFAKQILKVYGNEIAYVGISTDNTPVGKWIKKEFNGVTVDFFAFAKFDSTVKKGLVPARIVAYLNLKRFKKQILKKGIYKVFLRDQVLLKVIINWNLESICYYFPGVENPLSISKYKWAKMFPVLFDWWFMPALKKVNVVLAAADKKAIKELKKRSKEILNNIIIEQFPTHVDTDIFYPVDDTSLLRKEMNIPDDKIILVTTGRLHYAKGWDFILNVFYDYHMANRNSILIFVGDGADRKKVEAKIRSKKIENNVIITGKKTAQDVSKYLQSADIFLMGSKKEGWSTSLLEALACGLPIVTTAFSSADTIVKNGVNGYVIQQKDPKSFLKSIDMALKLKSVKNYSIKEIEKYSVNNLKKHIENVWKTSK